jgi:hypothetical protein
MDYGHKRIQGATTRNADRLLFVGVRPISGVGRCTLEIPLSLSCRSMDTVGGRWNIRGSRARRLGSRTDKSPTAKLPLEWPTQ